MFLIEEYIAVLHERGEVRKGTRGSRQPQRSTHPEMFLEGVEGCAVQGWTTHSRKRMYVLSICDSVSNAPR